MFLIKRRNGDLLFIRNNSLKYVRLNIIVHRTLCLTVARNIWEYNILVYWPLLVLRSQILSRPLLKYFPYLYQLCYFSWYAMYKMYTRHKISNYDQLIYTTFHLFSLLPQIMRTLFNCNNWTENNVLRI